MSRNVRLRVAYDGSRFFGWQRQDGFESVQGALEQALLEVTGQELTVRGSGRTDTGVHALAQVAHVHLDTDLADNRLWHALNANLPRGVTVTALCTAAPDFHAQKSAIGKRYGYLLETTRFPSPFLRKRAWHVRGQLDPGRMRAGMRHFVGEHDFTSLASSGSERATNVRRVFGVHLVERKGGLGFVVGGSGFLYNMVRTMVGTLVQVGRGKLEPDAVAEILAARDRKVAGPTAPPDGLYMLSVRYPEVLDWGD